MKGTKNEGKINEASKVDELKNKYELLKVNYRVSYFEAFHVSVYISSLYHNMLILMILW